MSKLRVNISLPLKLSSSSYVDVELTRDQISGPNDNKRENATLLMLVRNWELAEALDAMQSLEDRFNHKYHYDWTFLNDVPFDESFIEATTFMASGKTQYAQIPWGDWHRPPWINNTKFEEGLQSMDEQNVLYGSSHSYRNMCKFNSGYFFRQKILDPYDYYFRVEPGVKYHCDFPYDPFKVMRLNKKKYGFVISIYEYENTIPTLWNTVEAYLSDFKEDIDMDNNLYDFITDKSLIGEFQPAVGSSSDYNLCHFWSNFEIGDLNFFRSERYMNFFNYLEGTGGFYYERWGDAPVHSIGAALLLNKSEIIHFEDIAYYHAPFHQCPKAKNIWLTQRCRCDPNNDHNVGITISSCLMRWWKNGPGKTFIKEQGY
ncbi:putative mannosyltransferase KTR2 [Nakaseomyces bracarensis]|uniref:Mannosyltransferase KTR2 n=1 Tax=Nakaseomyces bracarensis TaxID=273131 RepID=A0ABR4NVV7_9SACH